MIHPQGLKSSVSPVAYGFLKKDGYNLVSIGTKENEWLLGRQVMVFAKDVFVKLMLSILVKKVFLYLLKILLTSKYSAYSFV